VDDEPADGTALRPGNLAAQASEEFVNLGDFIYKAPRLIDHERELELSKLDLYFPSGGMGRELRWESERHKLDHVFPYMIATGNLFALLSLFESYMFALCVGLQKSTPVKLSNVPGTGVNRLFKFLEKVGVTAGQVPLYPQVQAAIRIRNCLIHASGVLSWTHKDDSLRELQRSGQYLKPEHRNTSAEPFTFRHRHSATGLWSAMNTAIRCALTCAPISLHSVIRRKRLRYRIPANSVTR
jgi:hypothetical protein